MSDSPDESPPDGKPWWHGTVVLTTEYRLKKDPWGKLTLQRLVADTSFARKRWINIETATPGTSNDG